MAKILIVEDDVELAGLLKMWLTQEHHMVEVAYSGADGMQLLQGFEFDLVVLDWDVPEITGTEICRRLRARGCSILVLMLTRKGDVLEREAGLDSGADDYLVKPFFPKEFSARVRALLRRRATYQAETFQTATVVLDTRHHTVTVDGKGVRLLPLEFALLEFLMRNPDQHFSVDALLEKVWPASSESSAAAVRTCIKELRRKVDIDPSNPLITNTHGVGYRLESRREKR